MIVTGAVLLALAGAYLAGAAWLAHSRKLSFHQALLYLPLKLAYRIDDSRIAAARDAAAPVIYVVTHRSKLDAAVMLSLLPSNTLHILDPHSAQSMRLEPWRELARTIAFNAEHLFVSRRLVRHLRGKGRLAVYLPEAVEPSPKAFSLYRAVGRIAVRADANIVPIFIDGYRTVSPAVVRPAASTFPFPKLTISTLPAATIPQLGDRAALPSPPPSNILFDRVAEARFAAAKLSRPLFRAVLDAADRFGPSRTIMEDVVMGSLTYRRLFIAARVVGRKVTAQAGKAPTIGVLLPNANGVVITLLGLWSAGKAAAMINYTAGPANVASAIKTAAVKTVVSSRAFIEKAAIQDIVEAVEECRREDHLAGGCPQEHHRAGQAHGRSALAVAALPPETPKRRRSCCLRPARREPPKAVVLSHRNMQANAMQVEARLHLTPADKLLNVLPVFHSYGLTGGTILPLLVGVHTVLYPSPLHYKLIPDIAKKTRPTIMFATDTFLNAYAKTADDDDFASLRLVVAGAEAVKAETRKVWKERFGADLVEGFGMTEAAPVVAVNSATHGKPGSVGRLLPGMTAKLEPVEGIDEGGRLWVKGPNVMMGYMTADQPGVLQPLGDEMHDSGDIVAIDREGYLTIKGRAKRFAKIAGEMVSLGAVEMLAQSLWPEERHAVVAVPDKRRGERVVLVTTEDEADQNALRQYGKKAGVAELMLPSDIIKVPEIPVLGTGKTDYVSTQKLAMEKLGTVRAA